MATNHFKTPYHIGTSEGVRIVCTEKEREIIDWASEQLRNYNISNAPKWASMPSYHFKEAKEAYETKSQRCQNGRRV